MKKQGITASARPAPVHRHRRRILVSVAAIVAVTIIAQWPVTTRWGVNYQTSSKRIPLYEKAINFLSRDLQTQRIAQEITAGASSQTDKLLRVFTWVTANVRATPEGFLVVDDHPLHILIRGYGAEDQRTEAFVLLAGYSGFRAASTKVRPPGAAKPIMLALVRLPPKTVVFDVINGVVFRDDQGELVDVQVLLQHPRLISLAAPGLRVHGVAYEQAVLELRHLNRTFSRTAAQRFWPRLVQELGRFLGLNRHS